MTYLPSILCLLSLLLLGCSDGPNDCATSADCFSGELCVNGSCRVGNGENNGNNANNGNNQNNANNVIRTGPCLVDPFSVSCEDDENDSFSQTIDPAPKGCRNSGEFEPWTTTIDARMCGLETTDRYSQNLLPCDDVSFFLDVIFTPAEVCDPSLYTLEIGAQGNNCEDGGEDIQCLMMEDGSVHATIIIRPSISLETTFIRIDKGDAGDVDFDYTLELTVRQ